MSCPAVGSVNGVAGVNYHWCLPRPGPVVAKKASTSEKSKGDDIGRYEFRVWGKHKEALKIKQLVSEKKGFEKWSSGRHRSADSAPTPFDELYETLRLDRPQRGKKYNLPKEVKKLDDEAGVRAVFVTKHRRRYTIGDITAERRP